MGIPAQGYLQKVQAPWRYWRSQRSFDRCLVTYWRSPYHSRSVASWAGALFYGVPPTSRCSPQLSSSGRGRGVLFGSTSNSRRVPQVVLALVLALSSQPFGRWCLTHWRSFTALSAGFSIGGTSSTSAPILVLLTGPMISPLSGR